jgi:hypothetical protein
VRIGTHAALLLLLLLLLDWGGGAREEEEKIQFENNSLHYSFMFIAYCFYFN